MEQHEYRPGRKVIVGAVLAVTATYVYFLVFAQFGFLKAVQAVEVEAGGAIKLIMVVMGLAGMLGSGLAAWLFEVKQGRRLLAAGFVLCAAAAGLSLMAGSTVMLYPVALLVGLGAGFTTVTLASLLRRALGGERLGTVVGLGTGLAYGLCNLPVIFEASVAAQALMAMVAAGAGLAGTGLLVFAAPANKPTGSDYSKTGMLAWVLVFLVLVSLDSAAFSIIQHTPALKEEAWSGDGRLVANAAMHLVAALLAGYALDRRWVGRTAGAGAFALLAACLLMDESHHAFAEGALLYTAGVSVYSTVLVFYPARSLRPGLAALVYGVAGWGGSALGIGLADNQHVLPEGFILAAGGIILCALLARHHLRRCERDANI